MNDEYYLNRAYEIASKVDPHLVAPNPRVGCVIVREQRAESREQCIVAEGVHEYFGGAHAEVNAINKLIDLTTNQGNNEECCPVAQLPRCLVFRGCTVYITLEPCDGFHGKKTGSCTDLLMAARPSRVVIGALDPKFDGRSVEKMRAAGIEVEVFPPEAFSSKLNPFFEYYQKHRKPWITLKVGMSLDGRITINKRINVTTNQGNNEECCPVAELPRCQVNYITNKHSLAAVHQMRAYYSAMLTTTETILQDNPRMNCRLQSSDIVSQYAGEGVPWKASDPDIIILGKRDISKESKIWNLESRRAIHQFQTLDEFLESDLYARYDSIMTECGQEMNTLLLERGLIDEIRCFVAPKILGSGMMAFSIPGLTPVLTEGFKLHTYGELGGDLDLCYRKVD